MDSKRLEILGGGSNIGQLQEDLWKQNNNRTTTEQQQNNNRTTAMNNNEPTMNDSIV